ncbi:PIN domain-containing protein [Cryobacterium fucosi]|uniref:PIN domain-containing protein n=1 Tax=Cryobacterium fucosi TaxID=1259157 RepID=UPI00141B0E0D|nr:PIN domain-containing protein [Cryobacterium fucosi]
MTGSLDANVLLRLLLDDVPEQHQLAVSLVTDHGPNAVSDVAMIETIFVLGRAYELTRAEQYEAVMGLLRLPMIEGRSDLFEGAFADYLGHPELSFEDCYLVALAQTERREPLWTFDRKLAQQTDARLVTLDALSA